MSSELVNIGFRDVKLQLLARADDLFARDVLPVLVNHVKPKADRSCTYRHGDIRHRSVKVRRPVFTVGQANVEILSSGGWGKLPEAIHERGI